MRLYYFTSSEYGLLALANARLKISRINDLNDPFEFLGWNLRDPEKRAFMRKWKEERNNELGLVCCSRTWSNPLLWGHYADKHRGIAIGFEIPDGDKFHPVRYRRKRLPCPKDREIVDSDVDDLLLTKFSAWRYESEYRCFCILSESIREGDLYFEPFSDELRPVEVVVGDRSTVTRAELAKAIGDKYGEITSFKARPAFGTFDVVRNKKDQLWR